MKSKANVPIADIAKPEVTNGRNEAGVWPVSHNASVQVCINCQPVALSTAVRVEGLTGDDGYDIYGWHWVDTTWGPNSFPSLTTHQANLAIGPAVHERVYWTYWRYYCPDGTNQAVPLANPTASCRLFALLGDPGRVLEYKKGVAAAVRWASGAMYMDDVAWGICQGVRSKITYNPARVLDLTDPIGTMLTMAPGYGEVTEQGAPYNCRHHTQLMQALCGYHNIPVSIRYLWGGTNSFWSKQFYFYWFPYYAPQRGTVSMAMLEDGEDSCGPNPHFKWHAICRTATDCFDPTFGSGYPSIYCWHPQGSIQEDDALPGSYWQDDSYICPHN